MRFAGQLYSYRFFLKGQCHEIFDLWFFHQTIPPGALIHGLKHFCIWLRIRGVIDTAGSAAVSMTQLVPPQRIQLCKLGSKSYRTSGVIDTPGAGDLELERLWLPLKELHWQIVLPNSYKNCTKYIGVF
jgi:hypothetical protein